MSYILAFSIDGAEDVTRGYVQDWEETLKRRTRGSEESLAQALTAATTRRRFGLSSETLRRLEEEDQAQQAWLNGSRSQDVTGTELSRKSGTEEWKAERGEAGK